MDYALKLPILNNKFKIILGFVVLISIVIVFAIKMYNKPHIDVNNVPADVTVTALNIFNDFNQNEAMANEKYVDKVIEIKGEVSNISFEDGNSIITLSDPNGNSSIICHMLPEENKNVLTFKKGNSISIKGVCTGYLLDVMMVRCVLVN